MNGVIHKSGLVIEEVDKSLLDAVHLARLLPQHIVDDDGNAMAIA
jgi:hypothetical protein